MPKRTDIKKILVIGSGPIVIGQAAEFDYSGTQACQALKEEGYEVVLVNSNPATIMTDTTMADQVYIEPLTLDFVTRIIQKERPCALLPSLGGQTGLNLAVELHEHGILKKFNVEILGTNLDAIQKAEDRDLFRNEMSMINEPTPTSAVVHSLAEAYTFVEQVGYPIIVRPAFTLGGTGGGIVENEEDLIEIVTSGLKYSPVTQCLLEESIAGLTEVEFEVIRDANDEVIIVCDLENVDPVGIHTGDSIVVAPSQTISSEHYTMLRTAAIKIVRTIGIEGGCNVQMAFCPKTSDYYIIEVNPRVSRSSALASKATAYPIAKIAAKIAVGLHLSEIENAATGGTYSQFEPQLNYVVAKIPRWPFDKFAAANRTLGTQMKATGEVMAIGQNFEEALLKAIRSLELDRLHLSEPEFEQMTNETMEQRLIRADDERIFLIAEAFRRDYTVDNLFELTKINTYFLKKIANIISLEKQLASEPNNLTLLQTAKQHGFSDAALGDLWDTSERNIYNIRKENGIFPVYRIVKTEESNEGHCHPPYFYSTYTKESEWQQAKRKSVVVLGSGPIRIGQGIEFDYATVHSVWALREAGYEAIIVNNNPETVSTDFTTSDRLYFEPLTVEDVMHVIERENPEGVIIQFGGQTAINLAEELEERGVTILGTTLDNMDRAENRDQFEQLLRNLNIPQPKGRTATSVSGAVKIANQIGYPVLVRPSYVLGGRAMEIVYKEEELLHYMEHAVNVNPEHPVLIDRYLTGTEIEVDAISDGETVLIPGIMEHIERAGVHSGDSIAVYPPQNLSEEIKQLVIDRTIALAKGLNVVGLLNIQYVLHENELYVIEVNPRSSRTVPFLSKITGIPMPNLATKTILGSNLASLGYSTGLHPEVDGVYVKVPVFSFAKLRRVDVTLGPEMKSTGEVMGKDATLEKALYKGLLGSGMNIPTSGSVLFTIADKDKQEALPLVKRFHEIGFQILATEGTAAIIKKQNIPVTIVNKIEMQQPNLLDVIRQGKANFVINTLTKGKQPERDGFRIRREAVENEIVCLTSIDTALALLTVLEMITFSMTPMPEFLQKEVIHS